MFRFIAAIRRNLFDRQHVVILIEVTLLVAGVVPA